MIMPYYREMDLPYERADARELSPARVTFIRATYAHLAGALLALAALETVLLTMVPAETILRLFGGSNWSLLLIFGAFMGASFLAQYWAQSQTSVALQYAGLGLYVVAQAIIMFPLIWISTRIVPDNPYQLIGSAGILTMAVFCGLTAMVFLTGKDFSGLRPWLTVASFVAMGVIVAALIFGFGLGLFFSLAMVALMCGYLLYETSAVMRTYPTNMPVAAALALFASVATLFYYILRFLIALNGRR
jgi:FtsH-binding integral membrane protein